MLIGSEKPLWGEFNKLLYCIVILFIKTAFFPQISCIFFANRSMQFLKHKIVYINVWQL